jgi:hypothetical protein
MRNKVALLIERAPACPRLLNLTGNNHFCRAELQPNSVYFLFGLNGKYNVSLTGTVSADFCLIKWCNQNRNQGDRTMRAVTTAKTRTTAICVYHSVRKTLIGTGVVAIAFFVSTCLANAAPIIDNERVSVWDVTSTEDDPNPVPKTNDNVETICLKDSDDGSQKKGMVRFSNDGSIKLKPGERALIIDLKDHPSERTPNTSGYPLAYPRPHAKKLLENKRVIVWKYAWQPGVATQIHFHNKDVVVVYLEQTNLNSTTLDGKSTIIDHKAFDVRFNRRDRVHSELLVNASGSAIITELKDIPAH